MERHKRARIRAPPHSDDWVGCGLCSIKMRSPYSRQDQNPGLEHYGIPLSIEPVEGCAPELNYSCITLTSDRYVPLYVLFLHGPCSSRWSNLLGC